MKKKEEVRQKIKTFNWIVSLVLRLLSTLVAQNADSAISSGDVGAIVVNILKCFPGLMMSPPSDVIKV